MIAADQDVRGGSFVALRANLLSGSAGGKACVERLDRLEIPEELSSLLPGRQAKRPWVLHLYEKKRPATPGGWQHWLIARLEAPSVLRLSLSFVAKEVWKAHLFASGAPQVAYGP